MLFKVVPDINCSPCLYCPTSSHAPLSCAGSHRLRRKPFGMEQEREYQFSSISVLLIFRLSFLNIQDDGEKPSPPLTKQPTPNPIASPPPPVEGLSMLEQLKLKAQ